LTRELDLKKDRDQRAKAEKAQIERALEEIE